MGRIPKLEKERALRSASTKHCVEESYSPPACISRSSSTTSLSALFCRQLTDESSSSPTGVDFQLQSSPVPDSTSLPGKRQRRRRRRRTRRRSLERQQVPNDDDNDDDDKKQFLLPVADPITTNTCNLTTNPYSAALIRELIAQVFRLGRIRELMQHVTRWFILASEKQHSLQLLKNLSETLRNLSSLRRYDDDDEHRDGNGESSPLTTSRSRCCNEVDSSESQITENNLFKCHFRSCHLGRIPRITLPKTTPSSSSLHNMINNNNVTCRQQETQAIVDWLTELSQDLVRRNELFQVYQQDELSGLRQVSIFSSSSSSFNGNPLEIF